MPVRPSQGCRIARRRAPRARPDRQVASHPSTHVRRPRAGAISRAQTRTWKSRPASAPEWENPHPAPVRSSPRSRECDSSAAWDCGAAMGKSADGGPAADEAWGRGRRPRTSRARRVRHIVRARPARRQRDRMRSEARSAVANDRTSPATSGMGHRATDIDPRGMQRDQDPECCDEGEHGDAQEARMPAEGVARLPPSMRNMIDLGLPRAGGEDAMGFEPEPPIVFRRKHGRRGLAFDDLGAGRGSQQPVRRASSARAASQPARATERARRGRKDRDRRRTGDRPGPRSRGQPRRAARASRARGVTSREDSRAAAHRTTRHAHRRARARPRGRRRRRRALAQSASGTGVAPRRSSTPDACGASEEYRQPQTGDALRKRRVPCRDRRHDALRFRRRGTGRDVSVQVVQRVPGSTWCQNSDLVYSPPDEEPLCACLPLRSQLSWASRRCHSPVRSRLRRAFRLESMAWPEAEKALTPETVVVIPLGAGSKEHGPHLRLRNDLTLAEYLTQRVFNATSVVVAPTLTYHHYPAFLEISRFDLAVLNTARDMTADVVRTLSAYRSAAVLHPQYRRVDRARAAAGRGDARIRRRARPLYRPQCATGARDQGLHRAAWTALMRARSRYRA